MQGLDRGVTQRLADRTGISRDWLLVGALTVVALGLRCVFLWDSLLDDELFMYRIVHDQSLASVIHVVRETEKTPPLFFLLSWATIKLGDPTVWMRLPSLICGTLSVPLAFALGTRAAGRRVGFLAAGLVTISPFMMYYATNARAYAGLAFFAALSTLCLLRAVETNRRIWWAAYGLAVVAVVYTHYTGVIVLVVQAAWALFTRRDRLRELMVVHGLAVLCFLPWLPSFLVQQRHSNDEAARIALLSPPSWPRFGEYNAQELFAHPGTHIGALPGTPATIVILAVLAVCLATAAVRGWRARSRGVRLSAPLVLVALAALAAPIGIGLYSLQPDRSFLLPRNFSSSVIAAEVIIAWLLVSLGRRAGILAAAVALVAIGVGTVRSYVHENRRSQYRAAAQFIDARARRDDPVLEHFILKFGGALADVLTLNFAHPHPVVPPAEDESAAWARARHGAHVFIVQPLPGFFKASKHLPERTGPGNDFVRVAERRYRGLEDILVGEYALARP